VVDFLPLGDLASFLAGPHGVVLQEVVVSHLVVALLQEVEGEKVKLQGEAELLEVVASFQGVGVVTFQGEVCGQLVLAWSQLDTRQLFDQLNFVPAPPSTLCSKTAHFLCVFGHHCAFSGQMAGMTRND